MQTVSALSRKTLRYAITPGAATLGVADVTQDVTQDVAQDATRLAHAWATAGVDFIQLREPALAAGDLYACAIAMKQALAGSSTRLLVNSRADIALAALADGVHLTSRPGELTPAQVRALYAAAGLPTPVIGVSCHTLQEVRRAAAEGATFAVFGPVFEKQVAGELVRTGIGLDLLHEACAAAGELPILALGGVTPANQAQCLAAGAAGVAGIRLFDPAGA